MAEEAHNGAGAEKEATQNAVVFTAVKPQLFVKAPKAKDAVQFYKHAFGAEEVGRVNHPKRKAEQETPLILSVELKIGSSIFVVSDLTDEDSTAPVKTSLTGYVFYLETVDVNSSTAKAIAAGAIAEIKAEDGGADGGRLGAKLIDPYGNVWLLSKAVQVFSAGAIAEIKAEDGSADGGCVGAKLIDPYGNDWLVCSPVKESE
ncbi:hypothetical protein H5410_054977 [Solanum commersonii]|uniref:Glyoxalase At5g48480-like N-terminal domain-containing protein n=1 Tax=Solanum commersonii TaxID=4109 RepID=A0A9J5WGD2_SOLCO|nr:hypothetical protein H5410_054977 [Solanum commersonii]